MKQIKRALCLDLDGTIRYSKSGAKFIKNADDVAVYEDVPEVLEQFRKTGRYFIFGISNQGGIAFGYKTPDEVRAELKATYDAIETMAGQQYFDKTFISTSHPDGTEPDYAFRSLIRKPNYGLLVLAEQWAWEHGIIIDWDNSIFVGDRPEDEACAETAGLDFRWANEFFNRC